MTRDVACPNCRRKLRVPGAMSLREFQCPLCHTTFADSAASPTGVQPLNANLLPPGRSLPATEAGTAKATLPNPLTIPRPTARLYPPWYIALAFVLGGLMGGFVVVGLSFWALRKKAFAVISWGLAAIAGAVVVVVAGHKGVGPVVIGQWLIAMAFGLALPAILFRTTYQAHQAAGGEGRRFPPVLGVGVVCTALVVAGASIVNDLSDAVEHHFVNLPIGRRKSLDYDADKVDFDKAANVTSVLMYSLYDEIDQVLETRLTRSGVTYTLTVRLKTNALDDPELMAYFKRVHTALTEHIFPNSFVVVELEEEGGRRRSIR